MTITFQCQYCRKQVEAPDESAGRRGKCPFCGRSNYIPSLVKEEDILPLVPLNEEEERRRQRELEEIVKQERELVSGDAAPAMPPLEHREDLKSRDLHHFVVNYCLDVSRNNLERAETYVTELRRFGDVALEAIDDFISGKALEPALDAIPTGVLQGYLKKLRERVGAR